MAAAENVVVRDGVARLTLAATAAEAGLSKGGVLYHYPSRDALIVGMVDRLIEDFSADMSRSVAGDDSPGALSRAYVRATFSPGGEAEREQRLGAALVAAVAAEPALLAPLRDDVAGWQERLVDDGIDPVTATVLRLAADGLWFTEMFGLGTLEPELRDEVARRLESLIGGTP